MVTEKVNAELLLQEIREGLNHGTKYYNVEGKLLNTEKEIIETILWEGAITFEMEKL
jgi:hypothetical protein